MSDPFNVFDPNTGNTLATWDANGHLIGNNYAATVGNARANWGTLVISANDLGGNVGATSVTTPAAGAVCDVTFGKPFTTAPRSVVLSGSLSAYASNITTTGFTVTTLAAAASTTAYSWSFVVVG